jgi:hypothetical protein
MVQRGGLQVEAERSGIRLLLAWLLFVVIALTGVSNQR